MQVRAIALHLPQFHPIPENDRWWGPGFTEWTNVAKAQPLFRGHYQPHLPADTGFYDLRLPEARELQAKLAGQYGIHGFCYYHYWFHGHQLLEKPVQQILSSGQPNFPFCICWANESWSRRWLGESRDILMEQRYSPEDDVLHGRWLAAAFDDPRYIRHLGRPILLIWRPKDLPEGTIDRLAREVERHGVSRPFVVGVDSHCLGMDCRSFGCDATMAFAPQLGVLPLTLPDGHSWKRLVRNGLRGRFSGSSKTYDYSQVVASMVRLREGRDVIPCAFVGWDNSPRRGRNGVVVTGGSAAAYEAQLRECAAVAVRWCRDDPLLFINAWNEWAEGCHLEPDQRHGHAFLEATSKALADSNA